VGVYGPKTRQMQRAISYQTFQMTFKIANVYRYLGSRASVEPSIDDIQNLTFFEVPDRAYDKNSVPIHIGMEPMPEGKMDFSQFGIINPLGEELRIRVHINDFYCLGREITVGDALEVPFLAKDCDPAVFEVTDVDDGPSYEKFYVMVTIVPMNDSRKTREVEMNRSNDTLFDRVMDAADDKQEQDVPHEGLDESEIDSDYLAPLEPVDYRRDNQKSFLDDPLYEFTGEDEK